MLIKMKRDVAISYKYAWLLKGNTYDSTKLPEEIKKRVPEFLKKGVAVEIKGAKTKGAGVAKNYRVAQLEAKKAEAAKETADAAERQDAAFKTVKTEVEIVEAVVETEVVEVKTEVEIVKIPAPAAKRSRSKKTTKVAGA